MGVDMTTCEKCGSKNIRAALAADSYWKLTPGGKWKLDYFSIMEERAQIFCGDCDEELDHRHLPLSEQQYEYEYLCDHTVKTHLDYFSIEDAEEDEDEPTQGELPEERS